MVWRSRANDAHLGYFHLERDGSADILEPLAAEAGARQSLAGPDSSHCSGNEPLGVVNELGFFRSAVCVGWCSLSKQTSRERNVPERAEQDSRSAQRMMSRNSPLSFAACGAPCHELGVTVMGFPESMSAATSEHVASNPIPLTSAGSILDSRRTSWQADEMQDQTNGAGEVESAGWTGRKRVEPGLTLAAALLKDVLIVVVAPGRRVVGRLGDDVSLTRDESCPRRARAAALQSSSAGGELACGGAASRRQARFESGRRWWTHTSTPM